MNTGNIATTLHTHINTYEGNIYIVPYLPSTVLGT